MKKKKLIIFSLESQEHQLLHSTLSVYADRVKFPPMRDTASGPALKIKSKYGSQHYNALHISMT